MDKKRVRLLLCVIQVVRIYFPNRKRERALFHLALPFAIQTWTVSSSGRITTFQLRQSAGPGCPRRTRIDLVVPLGHAAVLVPGTPAEKTTDVPFTIKSYWVDLVGPEVFVPEFIDMTPPSAVFINSDDRDYVRVRLDPATLLFLEDHLHEVKV